MEAVKKPFVQHTLADEIKELKREQGLRHGVYPKFVAKGNLPPEDADYYLEVMFSAIRRLEALNYLVKSMNVGQAQTLNALATLLDDNQRKAFEFLMSNPQAVHQAIVTGQQ